MSRTDAQFKLRMPAALRAQVERSAWAARRFLNAEIVIRLEASFGPAAQCKQESNNDREVISALSKCVASLDQLLPYLGKVPADIGLLNDALVAARAVLAKQEVGHELCPTLGIYDFRTPRTAAALSAGPDGRNGETRSLPVHTLRPMPPRVCGADSHAANGPRRWDLEAAAFGVESETGLYLRETHAPARPPKYWSVVLDTGRPTPYVPIHEPFELVG